MVSEMARQTCSHELSHLSSLMNSYATERPTLGEVIDLSTTVGDDGGGASGGDERGRPIRKCLEHSLVLQKIMKT